MFPNFLYRLSGADIGTQWLTTIYSRLTGTFSTIGINVNIPVPEDEVWLIYSLCLRSVAGSGQTVMRSTITVSQTPNNSLIRAFLANSDVSGSVVNLDRQYNGMYIKGGVWLVGRGEFSASINPNTVAFDVVALRIPRGNFSSN